MDKTLLKSPRDINEFVRAQLNIKLRIKGIEKITCVRLKGALRLIKFASKVGGFNIEIGGMDE